MIMKYSRNIFIGLLVLDMIGLGSFWFGYSLLATKKANETLLREAISAENQKSAELLTLRRTLSRAQKERASLDKYFYNSGEESQISFVSRIEGLGSPISHSLVETRSLDLVAGTPPSFHGEFSVSGTWKELYHLLRLMEEFPGRLIIDRFVVSSEAAKKDPSLATWKGVISTDLVSVKNL